MAYPDSPTHVLDLVDLSVERFYLAREVGRALWMMEGMIEPESFNEIQENIRNIYITKGYDMLLAMETLGMTVRGKLV